MNHPDYWLNKNLASLSFFLFFFFFCSASRTVLKMQSGDLHSAGVKLGRVIHSRDH